MSFSTNLTFCFFYNTESLKLNARSGSCASAHLSGLKTYSIIKWPSYPFSSSKSIFNV